MSLMPFTEPSLCRYIYVNPENNGVHLMMPIVSGTSIGLDNTCQAVLSVQEFFGRSSHDEQRTALNELNRYKTALIFDLSLCDAAEVITQDFIHQDLGHSSILFIRKQRPEDINQLRGNYLFIEPHQLIYIHRDGREEPIPILNTAAFQASLEKKRMEALHLKNRNLPERLKLKSPEAIQDIALHQEEMTSFSSSGLGFDFAVIRGEEARGCCALDQPPRQRLKPKMSDLEAICRLEKMRIDDLALSRKNLSQSISASQLGFRR